MEFTLVIDVKFHGVKRPVRFSRSFVCKVYKLKESLSNKERIVDKVRATPLPRTAQQSE